MLTALAIFGGTIVAGLAAIGGCLVFIVARYFFEKKRPAKH